MPVNNVSKQFDSSIDEAGWQDRLNRLSQKDKIKEVSYEFESIFNEILLKSMRDSVQKSELVDGGNAEKIYQSMLDREYATQMARSSDFGLAAQIEKQLLNSLDAQIKESAGGQKSAGMDAYKASSLALSKKTSQN